MSKNSNYNLYSDCKESKLKEASNEFIDPCKIVREIDIIEDSLSYLKQSRSKQSKNALLMLKKTTAYSKNDIATRRIRRLVLEQVKRHTMNSNELRSVEKKFVQLKKNVKLR